MSLTFLIKFSWLAGVASENIRYKVCITKGPCPNNDPACAKFCQNKSYPKGGNCIDNVCCCDK